MNLRTSTACKCGTRADGSAGNTQVNYSTKTSQHQLESVKIPPKTNRRTVRLVVCQFSQPITSEALQPRLSQPMTLVFPRHGSP